MPPRGLIIWQVNSIGKTHCDFVTNGANVVFRDADARILEHRSSPDLIRPPVPRTGDDLVCDRAFAKRTATMKTHVVKREEFIGQPKHCDVPSRYGDHRAGAGCEVAHTPDDDELI
jgi:hypothetical protein